MVKTGYSKCPDCNGRDFTLAGSKGDGVCGHCDGTGKQTDAVRAIFGGLLDFPEYEPCEKCAGTIVCQTCDGEGWINDPEVDEEEPERTKKATISPSSNEYESKETTNNVSSNSGVPWMWLILFCVAVGGVIFYFYSNNIQSTYRPNMHASTNSEQTEPVADGVTTEQSAKKDEDREVQDVQEAPPIEVIDENEPVSILPEQTAPALPEPRTVEPTPQYSDKSHTKMLPNGQLVTEIPIQQYLKGTIGDYPVGAFLTQNPDETASFEYFFETNTSMRYYLTGYLPGNGSVELHGYLYNEAVELTLSSFGSCYNGHIASASGQVRLKVELCTVELIEPRR